MSIMCIIGTEVLGMSIASEVSELDLTAPRGLFFASQRSFRAAIAPPHPFKNDGDEYF